MIISDEIMEHDRKKFEVGESLERGFPFSQGRQKEDRLNVYPEDLNKEKAMSRKTLQISHSGLDLVGVAAVEIIQPISHVAGLPTPCHPWKHPAAAMGPYKSCFRHQLAPYPLHPWINWSLVWLPALPLHPTPPRTHLPCAPGRRPGGRIPGGQSRHI